MPTRRSTAEAFQILISHAFGDAGSPYLIGVMSEAIKGVLRTTVWATASEEIISIAENATAIEPRADALQADSNDIQFKALQYSLFTTSFVEVLGGVFFLLTAAYILKDRANVDRAVAGNGKFD